MTITAESSSDILNLDVQLMFISHEVYKLFFLFIHGTVNRFRLCRDKMINFCHINASIYTTESSTEHLPTIYLSLSRFVLPFFYNHLVITSTKARKMQHKTRMKHHISINKLN